jgi:hypothetical protein
MAKFVKVVYGAKKDARFKLDEYVGASMRLVEGYVQICDEENKIVAITRVADREAVVRIAEKEPKVDLKDPAKKFAAKVEKEHGKNPFDAVKATRSEMVALANDAESKSRRVRRLDGTAVQ